MSAMSWFYASLFLSVNMWLLVIVLASVCGVLLLVLLIVMICCCRRRWEVVFICLFEYIFLDLVEPVSLIKVTPPYLEEKKKKVSVCGSSWCKYDYPSIFHRRRDDDPPGGTPVRAKKYRPTRKSGTVFFETIDEDFTIPGRRLRATPPSASFREVANGLGAANRAMEQLSRVGQQHSQAVQARGPIQNLEPSYDDLVFDEFLENMVSMREKSYLESICANRFWYWTLHETYPARAVFPVNEVKVTC